MILAIFILGLACGFPLAIAILSAFYRPLPMLHEVLPQTMPLPVTEAMALPTGDLIRDWHRRHESEDAWLL